MPCAAWGASVKANDSGREGGALAPPLRWRPNPPSFMFLPVRTRLLDELLRERALPPKLLSIVAPVGYGKTVIMSELHAALNVAGKPCFWIGLDERDSNVERVIRAMHQTLAPADANLDPIQALLHGDTSLEARIEKLLGVIAGLPQPSTIFIDNLNSCVDEALGILCDALIFDTPRAVRLVWTGTTELAINLGRAKLEGLIRQIGLTELSLGTAEVRELLGADMAGRIGEAGVEMVTRQTEGWPAAVRMAQIILDNAERPMAALNAFSGSDNDIAALLNRQVLRGFPPDLRDFLMALGLLHTFSIELCKQATGFADADRHLDFLLRHNVFVIPLDRNREQYRLHGLLRDFLQREARHSLAPERRRAVLRRAAEWCQAHNEWRDAIDYALAAGETAMASDIMERTAALLIHGRGDIEQYIEWIEGLLMANVEIGWKALFWYVWSLIFHRRYETGRIQQQLLTRRLARYRTAGAPVPDDLPASIEYLGICLDLLTDRLDDTYARTERWLVMENSGDSYAHASVIGLRSICLMSFFRFAEARQNLGRIRPIMREISGAYTMGWVGMTQAAISIYEGDYRLARREMENCLAQASESLGADAILCDTIALVGAKCALELGQHGEARELLRLGLRTAYNHGLLDGILCGVDAAVGLWNGYDDTLVSIAHLREIAFGYPRRLALSLSCLLTRRLLRLGRLREAQAEAILVGLGAGSEPDAEQMAKPCYRDLWSATRIDLLVAGGCYDRAELLIGESFRLAVGEGRAARQVELHLVRVLIGMQTGNPRAAAKSLVLAISLAAPRGIVRPFIEQAGTIANLVNDTKVSAWTFALPEERAFFARICADLPVGNPLAHEYWSPWAGEAGTAIAPTPRESELLALLDIGLSNQCIADHTQTSVGTIKWHLKNLYRKLGVSSRSAALARARSLGLLN